MKNKLPLIVAIFLITATAIAATLTYTTDEVQTLLDAVNAKVSTSSGVSDAGKMVVLDATGQLDASVAGAGSVTTIKAEGTQEGGADIETLDFDAPFGVSESPDTEINIDIADDGLDSQHYAAGSIDPEHLNIENAETDEYFLTYESDTSNFQWVAAPGGGDITTVGLCTTGDCTADFIDATDIADGDHGDFTYTGGTAALDADVVSIDEMADADHGDFTYATGSATLDADVVDSAEIADDAVDSEHYTDASVDLVHLSADSVDGTKIADDAVNSEHYTNYSIDKIHLAGDTVDGTKVEDDAINSEHYVAGSIDNEHLAANSVDSDNYVDNSIDNAHLSDNSVDSDDYVDASIDEPHLNSTNAGTDNYVLSYNAAGTNFTWVPATSGGTLTSLKENNVAVGDADIVTLDFDAMFTVTESPDTEIQIDIDDDGVDSQHYAADSIDDEHINWGSGANQVDYSDIANGAISTSGTAATGELTVTGAVNTSVGIDAVGAVDLDYGSADVTDHTFVTDSTGTAEIVLPAGSIDGTEILDDTVDSADYAAGSIDEEHLNIANVAVDEYALTYEADTANFQWVAMTTGGTMKTVQEGDTNADGSGDDIVTLDFDSGVFALTELPDTEINIDIQDDGLDSQHYIAGSIDTEHIAADQIDGTLIADNAADSEHYTDASIDPEHLNFVVAPGAGSDEYVVTYEHSTGNFELEVDAGGANLGVYDGGVQVGDTDIDKLDLDGTVFAVTEPVDTDILIDIADDGIDSQHYAAGSVDNEHMNWADIDNLDDEGVLVSLGGNVAVGAHELQSTTNVVVQVGDAAGTNFFEVQTSGGATAFKIMSDGTQNPSDSPGVTGTHDTDNEDVFFFGMETGTKAATEADTILQGFTGNALDTFLEHDGGTDELTTTKAFNFGEPFTVLTGDDPTIAATSYRHTYRLSGTALSNSIVTLPASGLVAAGVGKVFTFVNTDLDGEFDLRITPAAGDQITDQNGVGCGADDDLILNGDGDSVTIIGMSDAAWYTISANSVSPTGITCE